MVKEIIKEFKEEFKLKGLVARVLGDQPTLPQKLVFWLMVLLLLPWPIGAFIAIFFFDASFIFFGDPIPGIIGFICSCGMALTIWLYPVYLLPLVRYWFKASKRIGATWLYYFCPLIPVAVFLLFGLIGSSELAKRKPKGYDWSTFVRLNESYSKDINHVYYIDEIVEGADPATFVAPDDDNPNGLAHDAHDYYRKAYPLHIEDVGSFIEKTRNWAVDSLYVYYLGDVGKLGKSKVPIGDYRSFHVLDYYFAADTKNVYYKNELVEGADPETFAVLEHNYAADAKNVYYENELVEGADPETFAVLKENPHYGKDKNRVYYKARGTTIRDLNDLKHKNMENGLWEAFHTDGTIVYSPELLPMPAGTDFATIHIVDQHCDWYADKKRVYYKDRLLPGANPKTFKIFQSHYVSIDRLFNTIYVSNNNKDTHYSYDGDRVYYRDSLMLGVDIPSFKCGYDFDDEMSFAFDKNRYYEGRPTPRIEKLRQGKCHVDSE